MGKPVEEQNSALPVTEKDTQTDTRAARRAARDNGAPADTAINGSKSSASKSGPVKPGPAKPRQEESLLQFFASIATVLVVGLFVITFVLQASEIPSGSMENTLLVGDHLFVDRITLAPKASWMPLVHYREVHRGDIIVFLKPGEPDLFLVKRVVGVPGDRIHLRHGVVYLNDKPQPEPWTQSNYDYDPYKTEFPSVSTDQGNGVTASWSVELPQHIQGDNLVVPDGNYFAMGDNRPNSLDSRFWGFVPRENIVGRPLFVYWSFVTPDDQVNKKDLSDRIGFIGHIILHIFDQTRWRRTLHLVR